MKGQPTFKFLSSWRLIPPPVAISLSNAPSNPIQAPGDLNKAPSAGRVVLRVGQEKVVSTAAFEV